MQNTFKREEKICLDQIIKMVLHDKKRDLEIAVDSNIRSLRRAFERLLKRLDCDIEIYKHNGVIEFAESEVPFMKSLLSQLHDNKGIIADFVNGGKKTKNSNDVYEFLELLKEEIEKAESEEKEQDMKDMLYFFTNLFLWSPLRCVERCHKLIDALAGNLSDLPADRQSDYMGRVEHILKKEFALRIAESTIEIIELAEKIEISKKENRDDIGIQKYYYERDPEMRFFYMQRDKRVLEEIQEDDDLRYYIEKKFGKKAEEIFNYAALDM